MAHQYAQLRTALLAETRKKVAAAVNQDMLVIQAITTLSQLEQSIHRLVKKAREWYALENPEYEHAEKDHDRFVLEASKQKAGKDSMGASLEAADSAAVQQQLVMIKQMTEQRDAVLAYLEKKMDQHYHNITVLAGGKIAAQLLSIAGSLERLATMPSSTLQLLGAETALFRHLRNRQRHRAPKFGVLFNHPLVQKLPASERGKAARALADKLSMCAKLDLFKGEKKAREYKKALEKRFTTW